MKWSEWKITERGINAPGMKELQFENRKAVIKNLGGCIGGSFMQGFLVLYENDIQVAKKHYLNIFIYRPQAEKEGEHFVLTGEIK